jgi:hypothetical protein
MLLIIAIVWFCSKIENTFLYSSWDKLSEVSLILQLYEFRGNDQLVGLLNFW